MNEAAVLRSANGESDACACIRGLIQRTAQWISTTKRATTCPQCRATDVMRLVASGLSTPTVGRFQWRRSKSQSFWLLISGRVKPFVGAARKRTTFSTARNMTYTYSYTLTDFWQLYTIRHSYSRILPLNISVSQDSRGRNRSDF